MQIELDHSAEALYAQIVAQVTSARDRGALAPGDRLPTVRDLAAQLGVNRNTVAHAYGLLRQAGVIVGQAGRGSHIAPIAEGAPQSSPSVLERRLPTESTGAAM